MNVLAIILSATCFLQQLECYYIKNLWDSFYDVEKTCNPLYDFFAGMPTYDEIYEKLSCLASINADKMKLGSLGKSIAGRDIPHVVISIGNAPNKTIILVDSLLHGDETNVLFAMNNLIDNLLKPEYSSLLYTIEWHLLPIVNPDGFVAGTRKNLANEGGDCVGVDLNRNFADALNASSQDVCSRDYSVNAFSEPETVALKNFFLEKGSRIEYYLALHGCHENRIIPVLAKNGEGATVESIKEMFVKARELKDIGYSMGVDYAVRSPMVLDETEFPEESKYEVQKAPNGNALTYAVDVAGVSKAFVIGHGPNQDKQRIVNGIWSIAQNVAQTIRNYQMKRFLDSPIVNHVQSIWTSMVNFDYVEFVKDSAAEIYAEILKREEADQVSRLWPQMQNLAKDFESITTDSIYEAYSKMNEARKRMTVNTLNKFNDVFSKFELTDSQTVYDYFSAVDNWTKEKASDIRSAMLDLSSKIKAMSSQDFVAHIDSMTSETIAEALRLVGEMQELTSTINFEIPEILETSMNDIDFYTKELAEKSWAHIQEVKSKIESLDLNTFTSGMSSLKGLPKIEVSKVVAELNEALKKLNVSIPESIYIPSFTMSNQTSEKVNEILSKLKKVAIELGKLTPDSFIGKFSGMTFYTKEYVMNAFNKMQTLISEIKYPVPQAVLDKYNEGKTLAEQQMSEFWNVMDSFASKMTVYGLDTDFLYNYISNLQWSNDKITESLTTLKDLAKKFEVPSASDVVTAVDDWSKAKASEMSNLMNDLSGKILSYNFNPQSIYEQLPTMGDLSMTKEKVMEAAQKLMQMFD